MTGWRPARGGVETRLRAEMEAQGVGVTELGIQTEVHDCLLTAYRSGRRVPAARNMLRIAEALDCHVEHLWRLPPSTLSADCA